MLHVAPLSTVDSRQDKVKNIFSVNSSKFTNFVITTFCKYKQAVDHKCQLMEFQVEDFVWVTLTKDQFLVGEYKSWLRRLVQKMIENIDSNASHVDNSLMIKVLQIQEQILCTLRRMIQSNISVRDILRPKYFFSPIVDDNRVSGQWSWIWSKD